MAPSSQKLSPSASHRLSLLGMPAEIRRLIFELLFRMIFEIGHEIDVDRTLAHSTPMAFIHRRFVPRHMTLLGPFGGAAHSLRLHDRNTDYATSRTYASPLHGLDPAYFSDSFRPRQRDLAFLGTCRSIHTEATGVMWEYIVAYLEMFPRMRSLKPGRPSIAGRERLNSSVSEDPLPGGTFRSIRNLRLDCGEPFEPFHGCYRGVEPEDFASRLEGLFERLHGGRHLRFLRLRLRPSVLSAGLDLEFLSKIDMSQLREHRTANMLEAAVLNREKAREEGAGEEEDEEEPGIPAWQRRSRKSNNRRKRMDKQIFQVAAHHPLANAVVLYVSEDRFDESEQKRARELLKRITSGTCVETWVETKDTEMERIQPFRRLSLSYFTDCFKRQETTRKVLL
jgi:hypothetical protein